MATLVCITGQDGTGKSTLIRGLAKVLPQARISHIWELLKSPVAGLPFQSKAQVDQFLCGLTPDSRLLFLAHAMKYSIDQALQSSSELILINSYHYKYMASELALGANPQLVDSLLTAFPLPDLVVKLSAPLEVAAHRKDQLSRYESGLADQASPTAFLTFQERIAREWPRLEQADWHHLDAEKSPEVLLNETLVLIQSLV